MKEHVVRIVELNEGKEASCRERLHKTISSDFFFEFC